MGHYKSVIVSSAVSCTVVHVVVSCMPAIPFRSAPGPSLRVPARPPQPTALRAVGGMQGSTYAPHLPLPHLRAFSPLPSPSPAPTRGPSTTPSPLTLALALPPALAR